MLQYERETLFGNDIDMTPAQLGDDLARLVWECFTDFLERQPELAGPADLEPQQDPAGRALPLAEELLILFLWVHTRACQQVFAGKADPALLRDTLDSLHRAVFEDLEAHGISRDELALFEQRVGARYAEYYDAAAGGDLTIGEIAARHVGGSVAARPVFQLSLAESAMAAANPLRDFLGDVVLVA